MLFVFGGFWDGVVCFVWVLGWFLPFLNYQAPRIPDQPSSPATEIAGKLCYTTLLHSVATTTKWQGLQHPGLLKHMPFHPSWRAYAHFLQELIKDLAVPNKTLWERSLHPTTYPGHGNMVSTPRTTTHASLLTLRVRSAVGKDIGLRPMHRWRWWSLRRMGMDCVNPAWGEMGQWWVLYNSHEKVISYQLATLVTTPQRIQSSVVLQELSTTFDCDPFCCWHKWSFGYVQWHPLCQVTQAST